ncbi:MAG TPA: LLM class flavin-dependent oxidoreductase [Promicromonospora sp.]|nr:LLM class flavin-dependent oxidoreductase [Promicromonospora sp.]
MSSTTHPRRWGFLSFGHHQDGPGSQARTARDALVQAVEIAVGAEELGLDGAWSRVHHFQHQFASPWALLGALAARTSRIELGTAVIDMRYENPLQAAELAAAADLLSDGRLQLGLSRGSQEPALRGYESFGYRPADGQHPGDMAREHTRLFRAAVAGEPLAVTDPAETGVRAPLPLTPHSAGLAQRLWWGSATRDSARWAGEHGYHLLSSTLLSEDTGVPFTQLQAEQIRLFRAAWGEAGHTGAPRVAVVRTVLPIVTAQDEALFGRSRYGAVEQVGVLGGAVSRFGRSYVGEPDQLVADLRADEAVQDADTLLLAIPNLLGVDANLRLLETVVQQIAPEV